jgi:hypothetical protein
VDVSQDPVDVSSESAIEAENQPPSRLGEGGVFWRVLRAHWDMKGATRAMLATEPSEARLLALIILAGLIYFAGQTAALILSGAEELQARVGAEFVSGVLMRGLAFYGVAGLTGLIARAFGGEASWRQSRTAVFWAALASAPVVFAATLGASALAENFNLALAVEMAGQAFFGYAFCVAVAQTNKFRTAWGVFGVTAATLAVIFGALSLVFGGPV